MSLSVTASVSQAAFQSISEEVRQLMLDKDPTYCLLTVMFGKSTQCSIATELWVQHMF